MEWKKDEFLLSDDKDLLNLERIRQMLSASYWASNRSLGTLRKCIENSVCFGLYHQGLQIGFTRVVTDKAVFSWLCDVIIHEEYRGKGIGKWMVECILEHPDIKETNQSLVTKDAHGFYELFGFKIDERMKRDPRKI